MKDSLTIIALIIGIIGTVISIILALFSLKKVRLELKSNSPSKKKIIVEPTIYEIIGYGGNAKEISNFENRENDTFHGKFFFFLFLCILYFLINKFFIMMGIDTHHFLFGSLSLISSFISPLWILAFITFPMGLDDKLNKKSCC